VPVLYDFDLDFFWNPNAPLGHLSQPKTLSPDPEEFFDFWAGAPVHIEHVEALAAWEKSGVLGWDCWHFDAHLDCGGPGPDSPLALPLGRRADHIHSGNFLLAALREGLLETLHWVLPPWLSRKEAAENVALVEPALAARIFIHSWPAARAELPPPDRVDLSFSPAFTPLSMLKFLGDNLPPGAEDLERWLNDFLAGRASALRGGPERPVWLADAPARPEGAVMFHGSAIPGLEKLAGEPLFLSPSPAVASCFGLPLSSARGWVQGVEQFAGAMPRTYLVMSSEAEDFLDKPMTLYAVRAAASCRPAGTLTGYEYSSPETHEVVHRRVFPSVRQALAEYGVVVGRRGENRLSPAFQKWPPELKAEAEKYFEMAWSDIASLSVMEESLAVFAAGRGQAGEAGTFNAPVWRRFLDRALCPALGPFYLNPEGPGHGLDHARETARLAGFLAWRAGRSPLAPMVAACLHDSARTGDGPEPEHAALGAKLARAFLKSSAGRRLPLARGEAGALVRAIAGHNRPGRAKGEIEAVLRDADRLRLSWAEGLKPEFFATDSGLKLAAAGPRAAANYLAFYENLGQATETPLEIKFELTDACNLACSFCHQGFGRKTAARSLGFSAYAAYLDLLAREGIENVRLTGGEPLLLPDLAEYLALAKRKGLSTTLNTNALLFNPRQFKDLWPNLDILKISLPAPTPENLAALGHPPEAWEKKLEAGALAAAHRVRVEFLTPMFPEAISNFDEFKRLLDPLPSFRWLPLRAEPAPGRRRPVTRLEMAGLIEKIRRLRHEERWADLQVYLAVPFCLLPSPEEAVPLLHGRRACGPFSSLVVEPSGRLFRCYSRRRPLRPAEGLKAAACRAAWADFEALPEFCRGCPVVYRCLGGCRCRAALTPEGFDYLADPAQAARWLGEA